MLAVAVGVRQPLAQHAIGLAAAATAAEEDFEHGAFQQRPARAVEAGRPGYCGLIGGGSGSIGTSTLGCCSGCGSCCGLRGACSIVLYFSSHSFFVSSGGTSTT